MNRAERLLSDLAVDQQPVALLEVPHGVIEARAESRSTRDAERLPRSGGRAIEPRLEVALELRHRGASVAALEDAFLGGRRRGRRLLGLVRHGLGRRRTGEHGQRLRPGLAVDLQCVPHLELANGVFDRSAVERPGLDLERVPDARRLAVEPRLQVALELHDVLAPRPS